MYRGLTRFAIKDGRVTTAEVEPDLAESWTISADGKRYEFKLRKNARFHDGSPVTSKDVLFTFNGQFTNESLADFLLGVPSLFQACHW